MLKRPAAAKVPGEAVLKRPAVAEVPDEAATSSGASEQVVYDLEGVPVPVRLYRRYAIYTCCSVCLDLNFCIFKFEFLFV